MTAETGSGSRAGIETSPPLAARPPVDPGGAPRSRGSRIARRVFQLGFLFFLIKGLAWLVLGFLAWKGLR